MQKGKKEVMNTKKIESGATRMIAHRGVSGLELENTHAAFVAAGNRSYWGVETDVHRTSDGQFIIYHDDNLKRLCGMDNVIEQTDFETLRALRLKGLDGENRADICLPSLKEYIRICKHYEKFCVLEIKNHMEEEDILRMIEEIEEEEYLEKVIFISFDFDNLVYVRKFRPNQTVQFLFVNFAEEILEKVIAHRFDVDIHYPKLTRELLDRFHANGITVNCWTVNEVEEGEALVRDGVDFITTNILE